MRSPRAVVLMATVVGVSASAGAQGAETSSARPDSLVGRFACPRSGVVAGMWTGLGDTTTARAGAPRSTVASRSSLDTTFVLDIASRDWRRDSLDAGVALGVAGGSEARGRWNACAGASIHLGQVEARLRNVTGQVHLHVAAGALDSLGRHSIGSSPDSPPRR